MRNAWRGTVPVCLREAKLPDRGRARISAVGADERASAILWFQVATFGHAVFLALPGISRRVTCWGKRAANGSRFSCATLVRPRGRPAPGRQPPRPVGLRALSSVSWVGALQHCRRRMVLGIDSSTTRRAPKQGRGSDPNT